MSYKLNSTMVGIAGPLSGDRAAHAPLVYHAADCFWNSGISSHIKDDKADPQTAISVAQKFVTQNVSCVVGHFNSACAQAVKEIYKAANIPVFLPASTQTNLTQDAEGIFFRMCSTDAEQARLIVSHIKESNIDWDKIDIAIDQSAYSHRLLDALTAQGVDMSLVTQSNLFDAPRDTASVRIVLGTCTNSLAAADVVNRLNWGGVSVYTDDSHVDAFADKYTAPLSGAAFVIGSKTSYEDLISQVSDIVKEGLEQEDMLSSWLSTSPLFDKSGQKTDAEWQVYALKDRQFIPHPNFMFGG